MTDIKQHERETAYNFKPIGFVRSCFREKFGIPRQPGLVTEATATLELLAPYGRPEAVRELMTFSHIWVVFVFHDSMHQGWKPTVRPPRLGGNKRIGVFATRSGFRPNPIGLSPVRLTGITEKKGAVTLHLSGVDLMDGTPVLDIKPYIPYSDNIENAQGGFATGKPEINIRVTFTDHALTECRSLEKKGYPRLVEFITQMLENDPRPAYCAGSTEERAFANKIFDFDLKWTSRGDVITVTDIKPSV